MLFPADLADYADELDFLRNLRDLRETSCSRQLLRFKIYQLMFPLKLITLALVGFRDRLLLIAPGSF